MIKNILKILSIIILALLQVTLLPYFGLKNAWPNLVLLVGLILILLEFDLESLLVASVGGIILDFANPLFFGFQTLILVGFVLITKFLLTRFLTEPNTLIIGIFLGLASLINDLIFILVARNFALSPLIINAFYSAIVGLIIYQLFEQWFKRVPLTKMAVE